MLSRRKSPFPSKDDSHRIRAWVSYSQKRVSYAPQPRQDSLGNSGDPNARVAFAGENKDGIDGHRHGTHLEYTGNLSGVVVENRVGRRTPKAQSREPVQRWQVRSGRPLLGGHHGDA